MVSGLKNNNPYFSTKVKISSSSIKFCSGLTKLIKSSNIFSGTSAIGSFMISSPVGPRPEKCLDKLNSATIAFISPLPKRQDC